MVNGDTVRFPCRSCGQPLAIDEDLAGRRVKCPVCGLIQDAPQTSVEALPQLASGWPPPSVVTAPVAPTGTPWERRGELGFFKALSDSARELATAPADFFARMRPESDTWSVTLFAILLLTFGAFVAVFYQTLWAAIGLSGDEKTVETLREFGGIFSQLEPRHLYIFMWVLLPVGVVFSFAGQVMMALLNHVGIILDGGGRGFPTTYKVVCYAQAAELLNIIPFLGPLLVFFVKLALCYVGFRVCHRLSAGKAAFAALLPAIVMLALSALCCVTVVVLITMGIFAWPH